MRILDLSVVVLVGCSGGGSGSTAALDCAWLNGPDNCWRGALAELEACGAPRSEMAGVTSGHGDASTCTYDDGLVVHFEGGDPAYPTVALERDGAFCARFEYAGGTEEVSMTLETASGEVQLFATPDQGSITCPDGSVFTTPDVYGLLGCGSVKDFPFGITTQGSGGIDLNGGPHGQTTLYECR